MSVVEAPLEIIGQIVLLTTLLLGFTFSIIVQLITNQSRDPHIHRCITQLFWAETSLVLSATSGVALLVRLRRVFNVLPGPHAENQIFDRLSAELDSIELVILSGFLLVGFIIGFIMFAWSINTLAYTHSPRLVKPLAIVWGLLTIPLLLIVIP